MRLPASGHYKLDGGETWQAFGVPSDSTTRFLPTDSLAKDRFILKLNCTGQVTLRFAPGPDARDDRRDVVSKTGSRGGATAFSTSVEAATLVVAPVNDAPVLGGISGSVGYSRSSPSIVLAPLATITDVDSAIDDYTAAIRLDPKRSELFEKRAKAFEGDGQNQSAADDKLTAEKLKAMR